MVMVAKRAMAADSNNTGNGYGKEGDRGEVGGKVGGEVGAKVGCKIGQW